MDHSTFNKLLVDRITKIKTILASKSVEYSTNDRLHNFKVAADISSTTPQKALWGMAMKHLVSVMDLINEDLDNTRHNVDEKIGDLINYLILLEAIFEDIRIDDPGIENTKRPEKDIINDFEKLLTNETTPWVNRVIDTDTNFIGR